MENKKEYLCLYHCPCPDGAFAAYSMYQYFGFYNMDFKGFTIGTNEKDNEIIFEMAIKKKTVYMLDYLGPKGFIERLIEKGINVILIDHHETAFNFKKDIESGKIVLADNSKLKMILDKTKSAATLTIGTSHPNWRNIELPNVVKCLDLVEDYDLWLFKIENSKAFHSGLNSLKINYDYYSNKSLFDQLSKLNPEELIEKGKIILKENENKIQEILKQKYIIDIPVFEDSDKLTPKMIYSCYAVDCDRFDLINDLGNNLAKQSLESEMQPFGAICIKVKDSNNEKIKISLRSINDFKTTIISEYYRGGGHGGASSFEISAKQFELIKKN